MARSKWLEIASLSRLNSQKRYHRSIITDAQAGKEGHGFLSIEIDTRGA